jgi:glycosyltransferase involved in cell wall biosynthesis
MMLVQGPTISASVGASCGEEFGPPLVSLVLINWNYAAYVGAAIDSIRGQDYPSLEAIVVDNGSTDASREIIAKHVADDGRFRIVHLEKNLGQLGAFLDVFKLIRGEFVSIVDADDILFPNFVSSHVQVHLALPSSIALTSSNVVEINADGRVLTGGYSQFGLASNPITRGLRPVETALRLSTVPNVDYLQLARSTSSHASEDGWIWGPGTSNMYRRSVLALVHHQPKDRTYFRAADNYLVPFCHVLAGSALIDRQLSAYRLHNANYFSERESVYRLGNGRPEVRQLQDKQCLDSLRVLFERAAYFEQMLPGVRFWKAVYRLSKALRDETGKFLTRPDTLQLFTDHYKTLRQVFGEAELLDNLRRTLVPKDLRVVIRGAYGRWIPPRLRLGNPREITIRELAEIVLGLTGSRSKIVHRPPQQDDPVLRRPDISEAERLLGWRPKVELEEGLNKTIAYFGDLLSRRQNDPSGLLAGGDQRRPAAAD